MCFLRQRVPLADYRVIDLRAEIVPCVSESWLIGHRDYLEVELCNEVTEQLVSVDSLTKDGCIPISSANDVIVSFLFFLFFSFF